MYTDTSIDLLINRIGFGSAQEIGFIPVVDESNSIGTSKRVFKAFHALVTVENIYAAVDIMDSGIDETFNKILFDFN